VQPAPSPRRSDYPVGSDGQRPSGHHPRGLLDKPPDWNNNHPREIPPPTSSAVRPRAGYRPPATISLQHRPERGQRFATFPDRHRRSAADAAAASFHVSDSPPLTLSPDEEQRLWQFLAEELPLFDSVRGLTRDPSSASGAGEAVVPTTEPIHAGHHR
jgi:hypothetical protein